MKLNDLFKRLEAVAPVSVSDELCKKYGLYDNSGIILNCCTDVCGVLFTLDLTLNAVDYARSCGFNAIVTHHPAIYGGISRLDAMSDPQAAAIAACLKNGISVISMHLNFDAAESGIDYYLMRAVGGSKAKQHLTVNGGGYGRVYPVKPVSFAELTKGLQAELNTQRIFAYGENKQINTAASFCGAGCDDRAIAFAAAEGADAFISSDLKHHEIRALLGRGINVIQLTHYASENYGFNKIYKEISSGLPVSSSYFCDAELA